MSEQLIEELTDEIDGLHDALEDATKEERRLREVNAELLAALGPLLEGWQAFKDSYGNQEDAYYKLAKGKHAAWEKIALLYARAEGEDNGR